LTSGPSSDVSDQKLQVIDGQIRAHDQGHPGGPPKVPHLIHVHREERTDAHGNTAKWDVPGAMQDPIPGKLSFDRYWAKKGVGPWKVEPSKRKRGRRHKNNKKTGTLDE